MQSLRSLKGVLRKQIRERLKALSPDLVERESSRVVEKFLASEEYRSSRRIAIYISTSEGEIDTAAVFRDAFASKKICFVPRCDGTIMEMVKVDSMEDYGALPRNAWNIPEPPLHEDREDAFADGGLDLVVMPGLAFDRNRNRLGHGKGYYDKFLERCEVKSKTSGFPVPLTVAFTLNDQILDECIPHDDHDRQPDVLMTPDETFR